MTTQKTTFENKPYSALFINGPYESRNVGIKLYFRYPGADPGFVVRGGVSRRGVWDRLRSPAGTRQSPGKGPRGLSPPEALGV